MSCLSNSIRKETSAGTSLKDMTIYLCVYQFNMLVPTTGRTPTITDFIERLERLVGMTTTAVANVTS